MKVAFCSSEVFPFAKTGGLADVSGALPLALARKGCEVKVFLPFYKKIEPERVITSPSFSGCPPYGYTKKDGVEFFFIKNDGYFIRDHLYGTAQGDYPDNAERFSFYSKGVCALLKEINFSPQVINTNDWQAALINIYLKTLYREDSFFKGTKSILTIHNLAYQGIFDREKFSLLGLPERYFTIDYLEYYGKVNLLKGGIVFSDFVSTVSPTYTKQIQTPDYGCGLDGVLRNKSGRLCGILNAVDYNVWNPKTDKFIYGTYTPQTLERKRLNKEKLKKDLKLKEDKDILLLGMVSRLAEQKGIDILSEALGRLLEKNQVIILGLGEEKYHKILEKKAKEDKKSFSLNLEFDEALAHRIYAACDCFLMPSRFEPCGLSQMISYKYATIPIAHHTGGLADTVVDLKEGGGGFVFSDYASEDLISAVERAREAFAEKDSWLKLMRKVTGYNFSWEAAADKYIEMYKRVAGSKSE